MVLVLLQHLPNHMHSYVKERVAALYRAEVMLLLVAQTPLPGNKKEEIERKSTCRKYPSIRKEQVLQWYMME